MTSHSAFEESSKTKKLSNSNTWSFCAHSKVVIFRFGENSSLICFILSTNSQNLLSSSKSPVSISSYPSVSDPEPSIKPFNRRLSPASKVHGKGSLFSSAKFKFSLTSCSSNPQWTFAPASQFSITDKSSTVIPNLLAIASTDKRSEIKFAVIPLLPIESNCTTASAILLDERTVLSQIE